MQRGGHTRAQALAKPVILSTAMSVPPVQLLLHTSFTTSATAHHHDSVSQPGVEAQGAVGAAAEFLVVAAGMCRHIHSGRCTKRESGEKYPESRLSDSPAEELCQDCPLSCCWGPCPSKCCGCTDDYPGRKGSGNGGASRLRWPVGAHRP